MSESIRAPIKTRSFGQRAANVTGARATRSAKLDETLVLGFCERLIDGEHPKGIAEELGVIQETIYRFDPVASGRTWSPETVTAMMAVRQNPWADGTRTVTDEHRKRFSEVGKARKGIAPSAERREQISRQSRGSGQPEGQDHRGSGPRDPGAARLAGPAKKDVAEQFGLHPNTVSKINSGEISSHLT